MKVNSTIFFTIISLFYSFLLMGAYFFRKRVNTPENKVYSKLIIINFVGIILELLCCVFAGYAVTHLQFYTILNKMYLVYLIVWCSVFGLYVFLISTDKKDKSELKRYMNKRIYSYLLVDIVFVLLISFLPVEFNFVNGYVFYSYGVAVDMVFVGSLIFIFFMIVCLFKNFKNIKSKKYLPIFVYLFFGLIIAFIQKLHPEILLYTAMETFITVIMYFTIENPDMKLLEEVHKSKEISDNSNEEKTLFLYNMTQEIRNTTNEIDDNVDMILESDNIDEGKEHAREIKIITSKFKTMTNEMFDVSKLDSAYIKVYNNKYNVKNIFKEIVTMYSNKCKTKNIDFRVNIDHDVPEVLYGDSINLKEVLSIILDNSFKYTKEGYIEFQVNTIIKNDVCRLIITIEDSGIGIKSEDINKMKIDNKSLSKANKLITLMNGTMMISSNYGFGTKVKVILDQKIDVIKNVDVVKYEEMYDNVKLLMVDDSDSGIKIIDKLIKNSNIKMDFATNGKECIDKIKSYGKYDVILLDEQLSQISAMELIKKIKSIRNFKIPVILLTKDNTYEYNDEFKKLGFSDYLLKPVKKDELLDKINKFVKKDK